MIEHPESADLWSFYGEGHPIVITTNGAMNGRGECVMGRGVALQAKQRFPGLPKSLGKILRSDGNHVYWFPTLHLFTFPVKETWTDTASYSLIEQSARELMTTANEMPEDLLYLPIFMPRPGCGNGRLHWAHVKPRIENILDDRFVIVERNL